MHTAAQQGKGGVRKRRIALFVAGCIAFGIAMGVSLFIAQERALQQEDVSDVQGGEAAQSSAPESGLAYAESDVVFIEGVDVARGFLTLHLSNGTEMEVDTGDERVLSVEYEQYDPATETFFSSVVDQVLVRPDKQGVLFVIQDDAPRAYGYEGVMQGQQLWEYDLRNDRITVIADAAEEWWSPQWHMQVPHVSVDAPVTVFAYSPSGRFIAHDRCGVHVYDRELAKETQVALLLDGAASVEDPCGPVPGSLDDFVWSNDGQTLVSKHIHGGGYSVSHVFSIDEATGVIAVRDVPEHIMNEYVDSEDIPTVAVPYNAHRIIGVHDDMLLFLRIWFENVDDALEEGRTQLIRYHLDMQQEYVMLDVEGLPAITYDPVEELLNINDADPDGAPENAAQVYQITRSGELAPVAIR